MGRFKSKAIRAVTKIARVKAVIKLISPFSLTQFLFFILSTPFIYNFFLLNNYTLKFVIL